jgi:hypothetical protein
MNLKAPRVCAWIVLIALVALTFSASAGVSFVFPLANSDDFNVVDWELRNLPGKWLYLSGRMVNGRLSVQEEDARVTSYLDLTLRITRLSRTVSTDRASAHELADLEQQRNAIENEVEAILAGRVSETLRDVGLQSSLPLFPKARWVFPPVSVEFDEPPNELAVSPRDRIELIDHRPLRHDLPLAEIVAMEASEERSGGRSALIEPVSGVATYPSLVEPDWDYQRLVEVVAHEWVHQYLFFHPLGRNFYDSLELRTLNETVATLAGRELSAIVLLENPLHPPYDKPVVVSPKAAVDVGATLRQLRADVDALLAFGQVEAAETLMEQRRRELADQGVVYRRINQAFFAFRNVYALEPGSTDPIGLKIVALRIRAGSVGAFLREASQFSSESDLDRALDGG